MNDLDLSCEKNYLRYFKEAKLLKMKFPDFWLNSYKSKNRFFYYVFSEARQHVEKRGLSKEFLEKDRCKELWERHCDLCFKEITLEMKGDFYCTKNGLDWICSDCFTRFKEYLKWEADEICDMPQEEFKEVHVETVE